MPVKLENDIEDQDFIDRINAIGGDDARVYGHIVGNLSYWDPEGEYKSFMRPLLKFRPEEELFDYTYAYAQTIEEDELKMMRLLGVPEASIADGSVYRMVFPSSSASIVSVLNLLKRGGVEKLGLIAPVYFSVDCVCDALSLWQNKYDTVDDAIADGCDALWLTSPIFNTGVPFSRELKDKIHRIHDELGVPLVFDESLCLNGGEMVREFKVDTKTFFIYEPHKAISVNAVKFSTVILHNNHLDFCDSWLDVFAGALTNSNIEALRHFASGNYLTECLPAYLGFVRARTEKFNAIVRRFPFARTREEGVGHYRLVYTTIETPSKRKFLDDLARIYKRTGAIFYPESVRCFRPGATLNFRVNLLLDEEHCLAGTEKVLSVLEEEMAK